MEEFQSIQQSCNWTLFHSNKKKTKNADMRGLRRRVQKPDTGYLSSFFFFGGGLNMHRLISSFDGACQARHKLLSDLYQWNKIPL